MDYVLNFGVWGMDYVLHFRVLDMDYVLHIWFDFYEKSYFGQILMKRLISFRKLFWFGVFEKVL